MITPRLETERLILRCFQDDDISAVYNGWETDPDVAKYMMWESHNDIEKTRAWIADEICNIAKDDWYRWALIKKETEELIGTCLIYYSDEESSYVVGYNLSKKFWGNGYTTEAMKRVLEFARNDLGLKLITGSHSVENPASGKVMEKIGMVYNQDCNYVCNGGKIRTKGKSYKIEF